AAPVVRRDEREVGPSRGDRRDPEQPGCFTSTAVIAKSRAERVREERRGHGQRGGDERISPLLHHGLRGCRCRCTLLWEGEMDERACPFGVPWLALVLGWGSSSGGDAPGSDVDATAATDDASGQDAGSDEASLVDRAGGDATDGGSPEAGSGLPGPLTQS